MSMLARLAAMGAGGIPQPSFVSSSISRSSAISTTVTAPANIQNGDLLVAFGVTDTGSQTVTLPTGFKLVHIEDTNDTIFIATKTASSESGNYTFTLNASSKNAVAILVYRNATTVNTVGVAARTTLETITASSISPTFVGVLCCAFASMSASTVATAPSGLTERALITGSSPGMGIYDLSNQQASATSAYSLTWSGSGSVAAIQFQVTNEPSVAPEFVASASTQNTDTNSSSLSINKPTGTAQGDLMIAVMSLPGSVSWTGDTGWTEVADQGAAPSLRVAYKTAGASEGSSYTFAHGGTKGTSSGCILTYRYAAYDLIAGSFTTGQNPLSLSSINPSLSQSLLIACGARSAASITLGTPAGMTAKVTNADATSPSYIVCEQQVAKGPTGTRSMSTGGTTNVAGIMLSIKPTRSLT